MKDIKSLYLAAKNSGGKNDILSYSEAVQTLLENSPNDYILNLEYIISSDIGLRTLKPFVEKHGLPIMCYDNVMEVLEKCQDKCNTSKKDDTEYKEAISYLESFRQKYIGCFMMESYFHDQLPDNYVSVYYGANQNGIPNRKLAAGIISKFGEAAIPDVLVTAHSIGGSAMETAMQFIESHQTIGNPVICEWVLEAVKNTVTDVTPVMEHMASKSIGSIIDNMNSRNHQVYREAVITGSDDKMFEYSEDEVHSIGDMISLNEYKLTWASELKESVSDIQKNIYNLYEEYDGMVDDSGIPVYESAGGREKATSKIVANLKSLQKEIKNLIKPVIKAGVKSANQGKGILSAKVQYPSTTVGFVNKKGSSQFLLKKTVDKNIDEIVDDSKDDFLKSIMISIQLEIGSTTKSLETKCIENYLKSLQQALGPMVRKKIITFDKTENYYISLTYWTIQIYISKDYLLDGVDTSFIESVEEFEEFIATSVAPMLPGPGNTQPIEEGQWLLNTTNKKTGEIPGYIKRNHNLGYGEDDGTTPEKTDLHGDPVSDTSADSTLDDFKRPSFDDTSTPYSGLEDEKDKVDEPIPTTTAPMTPEDRKAINNFYYYTYNNSLNKNNGSFNKDGSSHDDHSTHTSTKRTIDDHSKNKRINSDNINGLPEDAENVDQPVKESKDPWQLDIPGDEAYVEGVLAAVTATIFLAPVVIGAGAIISYIVSSKIMENKYRKNVEKAISKILGKQVKDEKHYIQKANKTFSSFISEHNDDIIKQFYKLKETGGKLDPNPKAFFSFGDKSSRNIDVSKCTDDELLLGAEEIVIGLLKKSEIKTITDTLNKISPDIKFGISGENDLPGDDSGGDWSYFIKAGICSGGPEECPVDNTDEKGAEKWLNDQYERIEKSGYIVSSISMFMSAKKFLLDNFSDGVKKESVITEDVGDADKDRPESDHPVKDVLTDIDRNLVKQQQGAKKVVQNVQNAGRAFVKPIGRTKQWLTNMVNKWKDTDENNVKEKMADPHARSNLFSGIKKAVVGGSLIKAGILLNPVFLFLSVTRGLGKNKREFRIRTEMIGELKTELEVIDEKIKDADRVGDNKEKYKLMRFKNELNKKLLRVGGGQGFGKKRWADIV